MSQLNEIYEKNPNITEGALRSAYLKLVREFHPDFHSEDVEKYTELTRELNEDYSELLGKIKTREESSSTRNANSKATSQARATASSTKFYSADPNVRKATFRDVTSKTTYNFNKRYGTSNREQSNTYKDVVSKYKNDYIIIPNNNGSYVFISKDFGISKIENEKIEKHKIMYLDMSDPKLALYKHEIYGKIDLKRISSDKNYENYVTNDLLTKNKLAKVSEKLYNYIGTTVQKGDKFEQECNIDILRGLKEKQEKERMNFVRENKTEFSLTELYQKEIASQTHSIYAYEDSNNNKDNKKIIETNINMQRMAVNREYKHSVVNEYLSQKNIDKCVKEKNGYVGDPEKDYKEGKMAGDFER